LAGFASISCEAFFEINSEVSVISLSEDNFSIPPRPPSTMFTVCVMPFSYAVAARLATTSVKF